MIGRVSSASRRFYLWLGAAATLGLGVRLAYALHDKWHQLPRGDSGYYYYSAQAITQGHWFIDGLRWKFLHQGIHASAQHPPLYTLFLAIPSAFGFTTFRDAILASIVIGTATVVVVGLAGRAIAGARIGIVAAFLAAIYANLWVSDALVLSETLTALIVAVLVWVSYRFWKQPSWGNAGTFGLLCGLAALTRGEVLLLLPIVGLPLAIGARTLAPRVRGQRLAVMVVAAALPVMPWLTYNISRFDKPVLFSTDLDTALVSANCQSTYYGTYLGWWDLACGSNRNANVKDESDRASQLRSDATHYIDSHKARLPVVVVARIARMWGLYRPGQTTNLNILENGRGPRNVADLALGEYYVLVVLAVGGIIMLRRRKTIVYPLVGLATVATLTAILIYGNTRFRVVAEVGIVLAAAVPLAALWDRWWPSRSEVLEPGAAEQHAKPTAAAAP